MNKDRGTIKWNALMLPEHVKLLRQWQEEDEWTNKPEIEEWQLEEMNKHLQAALCQQLFLNVTLWQDGKMQYFVSKVKRYKEIEGMIYFENGQHVTIADLVNIEAVYE